MIPAPARRSADAGDATAGKGAAEDRGDHHSMTAQERRDHRHSPTVRGACASPWKWYPRSGSEPAAQAVHQAQGMMKRMQKLGPKGLRGLMARAADCRSDRISFTGETRSSVGMTTRSKAYAVKIRLARGGARRSRFTSWWLPTSVVPATAASSKISASTTQAEPAAGQPQGRADIEWLKKGPANRDGPYPAARQRIWPSSSRPDALASAARRAFA